MGNKNPGKSTKKIKTLKTIFEARAEDGARVYFRNKNEKIEIIAISHKGNQESVLNHLEKLGY